MRRREVEAIGTYLRTLANKRRLTIVSVTTQAGVAANYIWRLENGELAEASVGIIAALVEAVGGSLEDVRQILGGMSKSAAKALAEQRYRISNTLTIEQQEYLSSLPSDDLEMVLEMARRMNRRGGG